MGHKEPPAAKSAAKAAFLEDLPGIAEKLRAIRETIISNILLIGQTPAPTFEETARAEILLERLSEAQTDICAMDDHNNPIGIIKGRSGGAVPPIFLVAHLDTFISADVDHNYVIRKHSITGPGILDNSASVGVLASLPFICQNLGLSFDSDIVLAGVTQSIGRGNLQGIRHLLKNWEGPIRGAVIMEGEQLGRLNYYSEGIIRAEIECKIPSSGNRQQRHKPNAILIINEVINEILAMELPQRPRSRVIIGKIDGGFKHGEIAFDARLGLEIQSDSDGMVKQMHNQIKDIVDGISHEHNVAMRLNVISTLNAATLKYRHLLVKSAVAVMKRLGITPVSESSESELSIFLANQIPAVTLGLSEGRNIHLNHASMEIGPLFTGIAQVLGVIKAIDEGCCDE
ncbi:MAG TPA: hypothetical protein VKO20_05840 [Desulfosalsimonadaceae bacterium]|nr:hypothetical protein [Desulfosalsimonadaceae bacterium]